MARTTFALAAAALALLVPASGGPGASTVAPSPTTAPPPAPDAAPASGRIGGLALRDELRQALAERRALEREREALAAQRAALEAWAAEIARARDELAAETARLEALLSQRGSAGAGERSSGPPTPAGLEALARAAKGMKPAEMAAVLAHLEPPTAADVLLRMRPADSGAVLAALPPETAGLLAAEMTRRPAPRRKR